MKLKFKEFNKVAKSMGFKDGQKLLTYLDYPELLENLAVNNNIGYEPVRRIFNAIGYRATKQVIDFEGGCIDDFRSKFISIGNYLI